MRMRTQEIADRRRLFELFTWLLDNNKALKEPEVRHCGVTSFVPHCVITSFVPHCGITRFVSSLLTCEFMGWGYFELFTWLLDNNKALKEPEVPGVECCVLSGGV